MSLFGKLDAANVKTNPKFIEAGDYPAEVTDARLKTNDDGTRLFMITYTINDENSMYLDKTVTKFYNLPSVDFDEEALALLPADEQKKVMGVISALKRDLCGNSANAKQRGLGVEEDALNNPEWDPKTLIGTKVDISISNYGPTKEGVNVRWVNLAD